MLFAMFYLTSVPLSADAVRLERRPALTSYALRHSSAVTDGPRGGADSSDALSPLSLGWPISLSLRASVVILFLLMMMAN